MDTIFNRKHDIGTILKFNDISQDVQHHASKVFATLATGVFFSAISAYANVFLQVGPLLSSILAIVALFALMMGRGSGSANPLYFFAFCAGKGMALTPLLQLAAHVDPSIVVTAFLGTCVVFTCFALSALLSKRRSFLYLGGMLSSAIFGMLLLQLGGLFFPSVLVFDINLYFGLLVFVGYVVYDTQMMIERADLGDRDYVWHATELFIDFVAIFVRILIILLKNSKKRENNR